MAIVSKTKIRVSNADFTQVIKCDANGTFTCELPSWVDVSLGRPHTPSGDTKHECLTLWSAFVAEYVDRSEVVNKCIVYEFNTGKSFSKGMVLDITATCAHETVTTTKNQKGLDVVKYNYEQIDETTIPMQMWDRPHVWDNKRIDNQVPWTEENEAFFTTLGVGMKTFIDKLENLGESPDNMIEFISSGVKLLGNK